MTIPFIFRFVKSSVLVLIAMNTWAVQGNAEPNSIIPGEMDVHLSTFHELRSTYKDEDVRFEVRSKMSGAYDVNVSFHFDKTELNAEFDLVDESMVLDGGNAILTDLQKQAMSHARRHLILYLQQEYVDQYPEHSFLAVQMLGYWSRAPKNFPIARREIQTRNHHNQ